jgi:hypothetical protein
MDSCANYGGGDSGREITVSDQADAGAGGADIGN